VPGVAPVASERLAIDRGVSDIEREWRISRPVGVIVGKIDVRVGTAVLAMSNSSEGRYS
jgi:hypothetical protein